MLHPPLLRGRSRALGTWAAPALPPSSSGHPCQRKSLDLDAFAGGVRCSVPELEPFISLLGFLRANLSMERASACARHRILANIGSVRAASSLTWGEWSAGGRAA